MHVFLAFVTLSLFSLTVFGQHNITVNDTDPSIQYQGGVGDASLCKVNPDGTAVGGQPGCYNLPSMCTSSVAMGQNQDGAASLTFQGSAIYINSLLFDLSPLYTVTLDGNATEVDGFRSSSTFLCQTLFSRTGLDPTVIHNISLTIKGQSPNQNTTASPSDNIFVFSLINFIYTADESTTPSNNSTTPSNNSTTPSNNSTTPSTSNAPSNSSTPTNSSIPPNASQPPSNNTKASSGASILATVSGLRRTGLAALVVLTSKLLSGAHWA